VHIGARLRALRRARGWTVGQAAEHAGLSRNTLSNAENAPLPNPTLSTLLALMDIYDLRSLEELIGPIPSQLVLRAWLARGRPD
jgi:transcriptional regulator with XRE-family HTH domain